MPYTSLMHSKRHARERMLRLRGGDADADADAEPTQEHVALPPPSAPIPGIPCPLCHERFVPGKVLREEYLDDEEAPVLLVVRCPHCEQEVEL